jgi:hypothetical protein
MTETPLRQGYDLYIYCGVAGRLDGPSWEGGLTALFLFNSCWFQEVRRDSAQSHRLRRGSCFSLLNLLKRCEVLG